MPKARKPNILPWVVFAALAAVVVGGGAWWMTHQAAPAAGAASANAVPPLPAGPQQYAGSNITEGHYLDPAGVKRSGAIAQANVLVVGKTATAIAHTYAMVAKRETIDCGAKTISQEMAGEYDATGKLVNNEILTGSIGRAAESSDFEVPVICAAKATPKWRAAPDWRSAQREMQMPADAYAAVAEAAPKDADAWAWLCRAGARGHWRKASGQDCDHAVKLAPDAAAVRLNRGYLDMAVGKNALAVADFREILAHDPDNAAALFGKSLVAALGGDKAGAKKDRDRALDLDPGVPDWIESNFRILISDPDRSK
jgi:hypothetical protein